MKVLVLGATGATGRLAVNQLLQGGQQVVALVRRTGVLTEHPNLEQVIGTSLSLNERDLSTLLMDVDRVVCCLGHNISFKGMYGAPRMMVRDSIKRVVQHLNPTRVNKVVLMNSTGCRNHDLHEPISIAQHCVLGLIRGLVPPHLDNERAGNFLRLLAKNSDHNIKNSVNLEWVVVRPDTLIDDADTCEVEVFDSPIQSAIFGNGKTSRINTARFMTDLMQDQGLWQQWQGKMPVVYNA